MIISSFNFVNIVPLDNVLLVLIVTYCHPLIRNYLWTLWISEYHKISSVCYVKLHSTYMYVCWWCCIFNSMLDYPPEYKCSFRTSATCVLERCPEFCFFSIFFAVTRPLSCWFIGQLDWSLSWPPGRESHPQSESLQVHLTDLRGLRSQTNPLCLWL